MSVGTAQVSSRKVEDDWKLFRCLEDISRLSEMTLAPAEYYKEYLNRLSRSMAGIAAAVWLQGEQGGIQLQSEVNLAKTGLDKLEASREIHDALLRHAFEQGRTVHLLPNRAIGAAQPGGPVPSNPTAFEVFLVPIIIDCQVVGLVEVWREFTSFSGTWWIQFLARTADFVSLYLRNHQRRQLLSQKKLWGQLESFSQQLHASLELGEVAYLIANEGRRLVECDRLSVAVRRGRRISVEAISGADVIEKRSNLVQRMRTLMDRVVRWGEKLTYAGTKDPSLPPEVFAALDSYLTMSNATRLAVLPLGDGPGKRRKPGSPAALLMESFQPEASLPQMVERLEVTGRHAASALSNAVAYRGIPMRWLWRPLALFQDGVGGPRRFLGILGFLMLLAFACVLNFTTCLLKTDARGQLVPCQRRWVYSPVEGQIVRFDENVRPGAVVTENQSLILMYDVQLANHLVELNHAIAEAQQTIEALSKQEITAATEAERLRLSAERQQQEFFCERKIQERRALRNRTNAEEDRPGYFWVKSPLNGSILNADFQEKLSNRYVKPSEPLLRIGNKEHGWEIELMIPQSHLGHIIRAFISDDPEEELDVDILLACSPTITFRGRLARWRIGSQATPRLDDPRETEPVVQAFVRIDGPGIEESDRVPPDLRITGTEVRCKVHCGQHRMGYSLFCGLWEFFYEKVVFLF
jgi:hypothetical protein